MSGLALSADGRSQVRRLAARLHTVGISSVVTSPVQRAMETATLLGAGLRLPVHSEPALDEVDFGEWTGAAFDDLASVPAWRQFNRFRATTPVPGGSSLLEVQSRVVNWMAQQAGSGPGAVVLAVTHADVIRSALAACAGLSLDLALRLDIAPSSISEVRLGPDLLVIGRINDTAHLELVP